MKAMFDVTQMNEVIEQQRRTINHLNSSLAKYQNHEKYLEGTPISKHTDDEIVRLNVGGMIFHTKKETLLSDSSSDSFFHALLAWDDDMVEKDRFGNIFLDRDPGLFTYILDLLRNRGLNANNDLLQNLDVGRICLLAEEVRFYQLNDLTELVNTFKLHLSQIALEFLKENSPSKLVMHHWQELKVLETKDTISYQFFPVDISRVRNVCLCPVIPFPSNESDNLKLNYVQFSSSRDVSLALTADAEQIKLGKKPYSFAFSPGYCSNNNNKRSYPCPWDNYLEGPVSLALWFDVRSRDFILYIDPNTDRQRKLVLFEKCILDPTKTWCFIIQMEGMCRFEVDKNATHPDLTNLIENPRTSDLAPFVAKVTPATALKEKKKNKKRKK